MSTIALLVGLTALVIGLGEYKWPSWRWRLLCYTWGAGLALAAVLVLPVVIGELS